MGKAKGKTYVPPSALLIFSFAIYSRFVLIPKKIRESTTEKNYNSLETVPDFYANDMLQQHFRYIHVETCLFLSVAQVGDALRVALLPELFLLDRELLRLV